MRISELSRRSGMPVATIKYYLREGLLPKGEATAATQAQYSTAHVQRLRLIRALADVGEVPLSGIRAILDSVDNENIDLHFLLGTAQHQLGPKVTVSTDDPDWEAAQHTTDAFIGELGWRVTSTSPARDQLSQAVWTLHRLGWDTDPDLLRDLARAAHQAAASELPRVDFERPRGEVVEYVVAMTVLLERALVALHRLAQEDVSARILGTDTSDY